MDIDSCLKWIGTDRYNTTEVSGLMFHMSVTAEGNYQDFKVRFASLYVERKVVEYCEQRIHKMVTQYIRDYEGHNASTRGFLFEAVAHRILARGGEFEVCIQLTITSRFLTSLILRSDDWGI